MGRDTKFQQKWMKFDEFRHWLQPVRDSVYHAFCTFCSSRFSVKSGGKGAVTAHSIGEGHIEEVKRSES